MNAPANIVLPRRQFLKGLAGILAAGFAPAAIGSGILMPIKPRVFVPTFEVAGAGGAYFNGRIWWVSNNGTIPMTLTAMEIEGGLIPTPRPIVLQPGDAVGFQQEARVFSWHTAALEADYKAPNVLGQSKT